MRSEQLQLFADIEERHWWFVARRLIVRRIVEQVAPPARTTRIVDIGCGTGGTLASFTKDYTCAGIDASPTAVALARARAPDVQFVCGAVDELAAIGRDADVFLLMDVIEHVADDFEFVSQVLATAKPGALLLITVPADMALWSAHDHTVLHYRRYDPERLRRVWDGLPVRLRWWSFFNSRLYPAIDVIRRLNRFGNRTSGAAGTDFEMRGALTNQLLMRIFAGEAGRLTRSLARGQHMPYKRGVSLIALLERLTGDVRIRTRPLDVAPDRVTWG